MSVTIIRAVCALSAAAFLAACGAPPASVTPQEVPGYGAIEDGGFTIPAVPARYVPPENRRTTVAYNGSEKPGTIVVDPHVKYLYHVRADGSADRYRIAVGDEGRGLKATTYVGRKAHWPRWTPTKNMIRTMPELYADKAAGMESGPLNPLGARALYLYRSGRDTMFRIHGTGDFTSIGRATSAGCIRLYNQDILALYEAVDSGATVKIRSVAESRALEGDAAVDAALAADAEWLAGAEERQQAQLLVAAEIERTTETLD
ncbi:L,D-transpeptidase [Falsigemmobacter intermedius]|uniref:L,D-transpeptidase n=1 Tax=Falsigemmobacter intermedius TaxID=1553448 RepID=A0A3S3UYK0_9RHOB|nr:L,D-transpeptidase [Falsigemmobacter intermedius]RWY42474.1 L,D-transpeptidase [Falsigemmobacter intermedius]